jgi:hypothetical protein
MCNNIVCRFRWFSFVWRLFLFLLTNPIPRSATMRRGMPQFTTPITLKRLFIILKMFLLSIILLFVSLMIMIPPASKWSPITTSVTIVKSSRLSSRFLLFLCKTQSLNCGSGKRFLLLKSFLFRQFCLQEYQKSWLSYVH